MKQDQRQPIRIYLTSEEVSLKFGVPEQTVRDWASSGEIIGRKIGARWFFPKEQFEVKAQIVCTACGNEIIGFKDELSLKEAHISGLCQDCQNKTFKEDQL